MKVRSLSRVRLSDPMDCSLPGSSVHGVFQARVLEWGAIAFSTSGGYLVIIPVYQDKHGEKGGRFTWLVDCRAHGSGKRPMGSG